MRKLKSFGLILSLVSVQPAFAQNDQCADLFQAACVNNREAGYSEKLTDQMREVVTEAKMTTLRQLGYQNFDTAFADMVKRMGLTLRSDMTAEDKKKIFSSDRYMSDTRKYFAEINKCYEVSSDLVTAPYYTDLATLQASYDKYKDYPAELLALQINFFKQSVPSLYQEIKTDCDNIKESNKTANPPVALPDTCKDENLLNLRKAAIAAYRNGSDAVITQFVTANLDKYTALKNHSRTVSQTASAGVSATPVTPVTELQDKIRELTRKVDYMSCYNLEKNVNAIFPQTKSNFFGAVTLSQVSHDFVIDRLFTPERFQLGQQLVNDVRESIKRFVGVWFPNDQLRLEKIRIQLDGLKFSWPRKLPRDYYITLPGVPFPVLNMEKLDISEEFWMSVLRSDYKDLTELNAYYHPNFKYGEANMPELFTLLAPFFELYKDQPKGMYSVIAHEIGHKIGYRISALNGHDLRREWRPVVNCMARPDSIRLTRGQEDEALADWISSHVVAELVAREPLETQEALVRANVEDFCQFYDSREGRLDMRQLTEAHPEDTLRINGIYGVQPGLRQMLGCQPQQTSDFIYCPISGVQQ